MSNPVIYVDVIEEEPLSEASFAQAKGVTVDELGDDHQRYLDQFQAWRLVVRSGGNQRTMLRSSERYFNEADAKHAATVCFSASTTVFLRQQEHGNVLLRQGVVE